MGYPRNTKNQKPKKGEEEEGKNEPAHGPSLTVMRAGVQVFDQSRFCLAVLCDRQTAATRRPTMAQVMETQPCAPSVNQ